MFFFNLVFTQFDCKSKESREGREIFFAKKGLGWGGGNGRKRDVTEDL